MNSVERKTNKYRGYLYDINSEKLVLVDVKDYRNKKVLLPSKTIPIDSINNLWYYRKNIGVRALAGYGLGVGAASVIVGTASGDSPNGWFNSWGSKSLITMGIGAVAYLCGGWLVIPIFSNKNISGSSLIKPENIERFQRKSIVYYMKDSTVINTDIYPYKLKELTTH
jgi:hypothetical protein